MFQKAIERVRGYFSPPPATPVLKALPPPPMTESRRLQKRVFDLGNRVEELRENGAPGSEIKAARKAFFEAIDDLDAHHEDQWQEARRDH